MRVALALWLGLVAAAAAAQTPQQTPLQRRVVAELLDYFHGSSNVRSLFKEQAVNGAIQREDPSGTFVQLRLHLVQTTCSKQAPRRHNCRPLDTRRKPICLACYKFDNTEAPKVLDKYHNCGPSHHLAAKEIRRRDEAECRAVEEAGKGGDSLYLPGMFAFSVGLPA